MKIDSDAWRFAGPAAVPALWALARGKRGLAAGLSLFPAAVAAFFRDPDRRPDLGRPVDPQDLVAPADGKIMYVGPGQPEMAPAGEWQQLTIFLNVTDVHINRSPYSGVVTEVLQVPGKYLTAFSHASGIENNRSEIWLRDEVDGEERIVVFRQVVGLLARRVVTRVAVGDRLATGERMGLMRFGSRMDVFVPPSVELLVAEGGRTVAGETVIGRWGAPPR